MGMFNPAHEEEAFFGGLYVKDFEAKAKRALHDTFGYVPDEANGERYAVYTGGIEPALIVIHATRRRGSTNLAAAACTSNSILIFQHKVPTNMPLPQHDADVAEQVQPVDAHALRNYLDRFITYNTNSRDVEHRWLASYAADLMTQAYNVKTGNHNTIKSMVEKFRLDEIVAARAELAKQDQVLEREAIKLLSIAQYVEPT